MVKKKTNVQIINLTIRCGRDKLCSFESSRKVAATAKFLSADRRDLKIDHLESPTADGNQFERWHQYPVDASKAGNLSTSKISDTNNRTEILGSGALQW